MNISTKRDGVSTSGNFNSKTLIRRWCTSPDVWSVHYGSAHTGPFRLGPRFALPRLLPGTGRFTTLRTLRLAHDAGSATSSALHLKTTTGFGTIPSGI